jgi:general stress protein 26
MSEQYNIDRVWDIIEKVGVCMLTTQFAGGLRARPIETRPDRDADLIFFVTDVRSAKEDEIDAAPDVGLVIVDPKDKALRTRDRGEAVPRLGRYGHEPPSPGGLSA